MTNKIEIECECPFCGEVNYVTVDEEKYDKYINGELVQNCFPELSISERELLITGICEKCWNNMLRLPSKEDIEDYLKEYYPNGIEKKQIGIVIKEVKEALIGADGKLVSECIKNIII